MGLKWTKEEDIILIEMIKENKTLAEISARLKRTVAGIKTRKIVLIQEKEKSSNPKEVRLVKKNNRLSIREINLAARELDMSYGEYVARMDGLI